MRSQRRHRLTIALALILLTTGRIWSQAPDWSGTWTTAGRDLTVLQNIHLTARGWDQLADNLAGAHAYSITIAQTADRFVVMFPTGANNILTTDVSAVGAGPRTNVRDRGEWWTKDVTAARWSGASLELTSTTSTGWWKDTSPENAAPAPTDFRKQLVFTGNDTTGELTLHVRLADEKGELEYVQRFRRDPS